MVSFIEIGLVVSPYQRGHTDTHTDTQTDIQTTWYFRTRTIQIHRLNVKTKRNPNKSIYEGLCIILSIYLSWTHIKINCYFNHNDLRLWHCWLQEVYIEVITSCCSKLYNRFFFSNISVFHNSLLLHEILLLNTEFWYARTV